MSEGHTSIPYLFVVFFVFLFYKESNGPTDNYAAIAQVDIQRQEPESLRKWREEQKARLEALGESHELNHRPTCILLLELGSSALPNFPQLTSERNPFFTSLKTPSFHSLTRLGIQGGRGRVERESQEGARGMARTPEWADGEEQGQQQVRVGQSPQQVYKEVTGAFGTVPSLWGRLWTQTVKLKWFPQRKLFIAHLLWN